MNQPNNTAITEFFLLGFQNLHNFKIPFFILLLKMYVMSISANVLIVLVVSTSRSLRTPMYFFLCHLSFCDVLLTTSIVPNMLHVILKEGSSISLYGCLLQFHMFGWCCVTECYILTVMSYDRYVAICNPLHYSSIMSLKLCLKLVALSWMVAFSLASMFTVLTASLQFCKDNTIDHFFCDFLPILEISCSDTSFVEMEDFIAAPFILVFPLAFIIFSYVSIAFTILGISSTTGRQKAFSTCSSHLAVVGGFYGTLISVYLAPSRGYVLNINKFTSLSYTMVTPLFNPIIYTLRNQEIRKASYVFFKLKLN